MFAKNKNNGNHDQFWLILKFVNVSFAYTTKKLKIKQGDEVIVPAVSWSTSYTPIYQLNLK